MDVIVVNVSVSPYEVIRVISFLNFYVRSSLCSPFESAHSLPHIKEKKMDRETKRATNLII